MSAAERLAAALAAAGMVTVATVYAEEMADADPDLAQDIEDGAALRRLREALPEGRSFQCGWSPSVQSFYCHDEDAEWGGDIRVNGYGPTIAAAADACRVALEASRA